MPTAGITAALEIAEAVGIPIGTGVIELVPSHELASSVSLLLQLGKLTGSVAI